MKYYQELVLIKHPEISPYFLWSKIYAQVHLALVEMQNAGKTSIGVSFPEYEISQNRGRLGNKLRLFAENQTDLENLTLAKWLARLNDYVHQTGFREVPGKVNQYAIYQRYHTLGNANLLARRYAKRHNVSLEEALKRYKNLEISLTELPFIRLKSLTNGNIFNLFINKKPVDSLINKGFNAYGLSTESSVPEF